MNCKLIFLILSLFCIFSCAHSGNIELCPENDWSNERIYESNLELKELSLSDSCNEDKLFIGALGLDTTFFKDCGNFYAVGADAVIRKSTLARMRADSITNEQINPTSTNDGTLIYKRKLDPSCQKIHILFSSVYGDLQNNIISAVRAWNDIDNCNLDFTVNCDTSNSTVNSCDMFFVVVNNIGYGDMFREESYPANYQGPAFVTLNITKDYYQIFYQYNGYIHYPVDGIRLVSSKDPKNLPIDQVKYEVNNTSEFVWL